ncbi:hypothetical protein L1049_011320 [Liquidambar formosana]|uniref:Uncharacterized protein n=1 Tax=Liquidambar formosana TaxID=63359 RepID=A0AAP0X2Q1_LIQFO
MGNWRWRQGGNYNQEARRSPPRSYNPQPRPPPPSGFWQNSVPSWEKKFCFLVGSVPWQKVVDAKKFMYCHNDVLNWDDSAGEEAFHNAKKRFWAEINGLYCDISLPDPDIYIDDIDWNPDIDPALILDLDREYVAPDEEEKCGKVRDTSQKINKFEYSSGSGVCDKNQNNCDNPWEYNHVQGTGSSEDKAWGRDQWDVCVNESRNLDNDDNPWERSYAQNNGALKDNMLGDHGDKSWGWNQGENHINQSRNFDNVDNPWERGSQGVGSVQGKGWGDFRENLQGWNHWENSINESRNLDTGNNSWGQSFIQGNGALKDRGWRDCGDNTWGSKQWDNYNNEPKNLDSKRGSGGWGAQNGGCRKREGSHQYMSRYKSSRFQGDDHQRGNYWRNGRDKKRVSFVFE